MQHLYAMTGGTDKRSHHEFQVSFVTLSAVSKADSSAGPGGSIRTTAARCFATPPSREWRGAAHSPAITKLAFLRGAAGPIGVSSVIVLNSVPAGTHTVVVDSFKPHGGNDQLTADVE